jgi:hypothetical protein
MENKKKPGNKSFKEILPDPKENIISGAKVFSKKSSDIFNSFLDKVKKAAETAYGKSTEIVENVTLTAQDYIDTYKDRAEISNLKKVRDEVATQLGNMCYIEYSGRYKFRVEFMKSNEFKTLLAQIRELDKQIIKIGKRIEEEK